MASRLRSPKLCSPPLLLLLASWLAASPVHAQLNITAPANTIGSEATQTAQNLFSSLFGDMGAAAIVVAILCIIVGVMFVFFGYRLFRIILALAGAIFLAAVAYILMASLEPAGGYQFAISRQAFYVLIMLAAAIIGALLSTLIFYLGMFVLGVLAGAILAFFIQSLKSGGLLPYPIGFSILLGILGIAGGIVAVYFQRFIIIVSTAFSGSFLMFFGIDVFVRTGFYLLPQVFLTFTQTLGFSYNVTGGVIGMIAGWGVLGLIGTLFQYYVWSPERYGPQAYWRDRKEHTTYTSGKYWRA